MTPELRGTPASTESTMPSNSPGLTSTPGTTNVRERSCAVLCHNTLTIRPCWPNWLAQIIYLITIRAQPRAHTLRCPPRRMTSWPCGFMRCRLLAWVVCMTPCGGVAGGDRSS